MLVTFESTVYTEGNEFDESGWTEVVKEFTQSPIDAGMPYSSDPAFLLPREILLSKYVTVWSTSLEQFKLSVSLLVSSRLACHWSSFSYLEILLLSGLKDREPKQEKGLYTNIVVLVRK